MEAKNQTRLKATVGASCCALLLHYVPAFEGTVLRGYRDPIGIVTACTGHTATAVLGRPYTEEECQEFLVDDLLEKAQGVKSCLGDAPRTYYQLASIISFSFNVGESRFCNSTIGRDAAAGDWPHACAQMSRWIYAGDKVLPGLVKRRAIERDMCEGNLG